MDILPAFAVTAKTVGEALDFSAECLQRSGVCFGHGCDNAWDEAVQLVLTVLELPLDAGEEVLLHKLSRRHRERLATLLQARIKQRVPLPYLLGRAWFAGLELLCDRRAIVPRSPLAELICNGFLPWYLGPGPERVLDLCCGGGGIGLATAHYLPQTAVDLVDIDSDALALARENARLLAVDARVEILQSDLFSALGGRRYDLILSNPPYVDADDLATMPAEYRHEPDIALGSGVDGLDMTRRILAGAGAYLEPHGLLILEVGNSWRHLERLYPRVPFTWIDFEQGGHGVFALSASELREFRASWRG